MKLNQSHVSFALLFLAIGLCPLFFTSGELREYFLYGITNGPFACHINGTQVFLDDLNFANLSSEAEMQEAENYMRRLEDCERQTYAPVPPYLCATPPAFCGNASSLMITLADCVILENKVFVNRVFSHEISLSTMRSIKAFVKEQEEQTAILDIIEELNSILLHTQPGTIREWDVPLNIDWLRKICNATNSATEK